MPGIKLFNIQHQGVVHTPLLVIHGESTYSRTGVLTVSHQYNAFPPLYFEVNHGFFKAVIHLDDNANDLVLTHSSGTVANGFPQFTARPSFEPGVVGLTIYYQPLRNNRPVHLCLLVAKDSPALFDSTGLKKSYEGNGLDVALKKLRIGGRLMQAFTHEQMLRAGFGNRTFNFYEEVSKETEFYQELAEPKARHNIKVHVLKSDKTLRELRDPNLAQQNSKGNNTGGLFGIANDALLKYGGPFNTKETVQAAVMFLDTHWDTNLKLILTHAALGGGIGNIKLAIFGSHGLYSWPNYLEQVVPAFQDTTRSSINEVANDANQCSSYWECLNITLGAFMHEIGHSLGCPHQTSGVMLRDYVTLNRSFVTRETYCIRTNSQGLNPVLPKDECAWHRLDLLRFLYHPSFQLPEDINDASFGRQNNTGGNAMVLPIGNNQAIIRSNSGIYAVEIFAREIADAYFEYLPLSLGGKGIQHEILVTANDLKMMLPRDRQNVKDFRINVLCVGGQTDCDNVTAKLSPRNRENFIDIKSDEINRDGPAVTTGIKSNSLGRFEKSKEQIVLFDPNTLTNIRVYHGYAIDGLRFDYIKTTGTNNPQAPSKAVPPPVPARNYSLTRAFKSLGLNKTPPSESVIQPSQQTESKQEAAQPAPSARKAEKRSVLFGNQTGNYTDFQLSQGESLQGFNLKTGAWIDCIQIVTSSGRVSKHLGNFNGGGPGTLEAPDRNQFDIVGVFGNTGDWVDSIGIIYAKKK